MIEVIPSISVIRGKVVRLQQGDFSNETQYDDHDPIDIARQFEEIGVRKVHVIDLEGAKTGAPSNFHVIEAISRYTNLHINFSGGVYTDGDLAHSFECGAKSVTVGTISVKDPELFGSWIISFGRERIALSADALHNRIAVGGWQRSTKIDILEHIERFYYRGLKYVKVTDIAKDGCLEGPNFELYKQIVKEFPDLYVAASGGVRNADDIQQLEDIGVRGVIFGKAFYEGKISLDELGRFASTAITA